MAEAEVKVKLPALAQRYAATLKSKIDSRTVEL
jgi:hypothetical protein